MSSKQINNIIFIIAILFFLYGIFELTSNSNKSNSYQFDYGRFENNIYKNNLLGWELPLNGKYNIYSNEEVAKKYLNLKEIYKSENINVNNFGNLFWIYNDSLDIHCFIEPKNSRKNLISEIDYINRTIQSFQQLRIPSFNYTIKGNESIDKNSFVVFESEYLNFRGKHLFEKNFVRSTKNYILIVQFIASKPITEQITSFIKTSKMKDISNI